MLTHDFILDVILPPLLFEAAINIHWRPLSRDMLLVLTLSTLGVIVSAAFVAAGMAFLLSWPAMPALVFGVLIAATDPIAVIALFKDIGVTGRLRLLVESESLFNDGVAAVLFGLTLTWTQSLQGASMSGAMVALTLAKVAGGGVLIGIACGIVAIAFAWRTSDHPVETALTAVAAYRTGGPGRTAHPSFPSSSCGPVSFRRSSMVRRRRISRSPASPRRCPIPRPSRSARSHETPRLSEPVGKRTTSYGSQQSSSREPIVGSASNLPVNTWLTDGAYLPRAATRTPQASSDAWRKTQGACSMSLQWT